MKAILAKQKKKEHKLNIEIERMRNMEKRHASCRQDREDISNLNGENEKQGKE